MSTDSIRQAAYKIHRVAQRPQPRRGEERKRIVFVASESDWQFEIMGPMYVFTCANFALEHSGYPEMGYDMEVVSTDVGDTYAIPGLRVTTDRHFTELEGRVDTLVFQPIDELLLENRQDGFIAWVREQASRVERMVGICHATYIFAEAGLLDGRCATTHWAYEEHFRTHYPQTKLQAESIYCRDGSYYTSAGATAGLDLCLALVEEDFGVEVARLVSKTLVLFLKRPGNQAQFSVQLQSRLPESSKMNDVQSYIFANLEGDLRVPTLAERAAMSPRNFSRVFTREVGVGPGEFVERARLERARHLLVNDGLTTEAVAHKCGYRTGDGLRQAFERNLGVSPSGYRARFETASR